MKHPMNDANRDALSGSTDGVSFLLRKRWWGIAALGLLVALVCPWIPYATVADNALTVWFLDTDPQLQAYRTFQETFGNDEVILLQVHEPKGIFEPQTLTKLQTLQDRLKEIDGVGRVLSILNAYDLQETPNGLLNGPLLPKNKRHNKQELARIEKIFTSHDLFRDRLINAEGSRAMFWIWMDLMQDIDAQRDAIVEKVRSSANEVLGQTEHPMGGIGVIYSGLNVITQHDFGIFVSLGYLMMFLLLWWAFRSLRLVAAAVGVVALATLGVLGFYGFMGHQLNMVTVVLPILIIVLGIADAVHFPAAFADIAAQTPGLSHFEVAHRSFKRSLAPCLMTTLTTMAGLLALASSPMAVIRHLGIYAALGLGLAFLASVLLMSATLIKLPGDIRIPKNKGIKTILDLCVRGVQQKPLTMLTLSLAITAIAAVGALRVKADTYTLGYLPEDHPVVLDHKTIEAQWGPYSVLDFLTKPHDPLQMDSPEVLAALDAFSQRAIRDPDVSQAIGLHQVYRHIAKVWGWEGTEKDALSPELVAQLTLLLDSLGLTWNSSDPQYNENFMASLTTQDRSLGRLTLVGRMMSAVELDQALGRTAKIAKETLGDVAQLIPTGYPPLYVRIVDYIISSQIRSFLIAVGIIFVLMLLWLRSLRLALISLVPNLFPVLVMLGVMGALGIDLDVATATVAAIVIGVAVDDTVHFLHHWHNAEKKGLDWAACQQHTFDTAGRAAVVTTLLLAGGYPILMLGQVATVFYFGLLTTVAALAALYGDLIILPLMLRGMARWRQT